MSNRVINVTFWSNISQSFDRYHIGFLEEKKQWFGLKIMYYWFGTA